MELPDYVPVFPIFFSVFSTKRIVNLRLKDTRQERGGGRDWYKSNFLKSQGPFKLT
jgi:hypothetical protein